jgi:predicted transcriptional regulator
MEKPEEAFPRIRALLAHKLVKKYGLKKSLVARVMAVSPSAVTQYLAGRRGGRQGDAKLVEEIESLAARVARKIELGLVEAAASEVQAYLNQLISPKPAQPQQTDGSRLEEIINSLRSRMELEEEAARKSLELSSRATSPLAKLLLKQMAVDSLRHADIINMVIVALRSGGDTSINASDATLISQMSIFESLSETQKLSETPIASLSPTIRALLLSIDMDEEKHEKLLKIALSGQPAEPEA